MNNASIDVLQLMLRKAENKLNVAKNDFKSGFYDDAPSRAYYAVYHAITAVLAQKGLSFSSHAQTIGAFNREFIKTGIMPSDTFRKIQRLFDDRHSADYDLNLLIDKEQAEQDIIDAEWLINECVKYLEKQTGRKFNLK